MGQFINWLHEAFCTDNGRHTAEAAASKMEWLEPRLLLNGATWQGPIIDIGPETAQGGNAVAVDVAGEDGTDNTPLVSATTYQDLVGVPPNPATLAFSGWCNDLLTARLNQVTTPVVIYYFAAGGDDATGNGSRAHPWQSIAKANAMLATDGTCCLFNRGDEWPTLVGLVMAGNDTSVGSYGDANKPKPLIDCFTHTIPTSAAWTQVNGTNDYTYAVSAGSPAIVVSGTGTIGGVSADGAYSPVGTYNGQTTYHNSTNNFWFFYMPSWGNLWLLTDAAPGSYPENWWCAVGSVASSAYTYDTRGGTADNGASGVAVDWLTPAWIRDKDRRFDAYAWMGTAAAMTAGAGQGDAIAAAIHLVESTPYSWFYDPTTYLLHVNAGGASPATISWEWSDTTSVANNGVSIEQSGYVLGLRTDGWGCGPALGEVIAQHWGIMFSGGFGMNAVVEDCEAYYNGRHNIGSDGISGAMTVINCVVGFTDNTDAEGTGAFVGFSAEGGNELILWNCAQRFSNLPWSGGPLSGWCPSETVDTHCGSGTVGLVLVWGLRVTGETDWHNATWGDGMLYLYDPCLPGSDLTTYRAWVVSSSYDVPSAPVCGNSTGGNAKIALINCRQRITLTLSDAVGATSAVYINYGWSINESIDIVDPDGGPTGSRYLATLGRVINQSVRVTCLNPAEIVTAGDWGIRTSTLTNCEFSVIGAAATSAITIPTANCSHNAYSGLADRRTGTEAGEVSLTSALDPLASPPPGSALYDAGGSTVTALGAALEYDINWYPRSAGTPSIGAVEAAAMSGDANNDGAVDVIDLGILAKYYDTTSGATWARGDFNGDGAVDVVDLGILAKNYGWARAAVGSGAGVSAEHALAVSLLAQTIQDSGGTSGQAPASVQTGSLQPLLAGQLATAWEYSPDVLSAGNALDMVSPALMAWGVARASLIQAQPLNLLAVLGAPSDRAAAWPVVAERVVASRAATLGGELKLLSLNDLGL